MWIAPLFGSDGSASVDMHNAAFLTPHAPQPSAPYQVLRRGLSSDSSRRKWLEALLSDEKLEWDEVSTLLNLRTTTWQKCEAVPRRARI